MGHAQKKLESVQSRTVLPPALPTRSGIAPKSTKQSPRVKPPTPPVAALQIAHAPKSPLPQADLQLALLPQWADSNAPLLPAKKSRFGLGFWLGSSSLGLAVGALVAAGLMGTPVPQTVHTAPAQPVLVAHEAVIAAQPTAAEATPDMEIGIEEASAHETATVAPALVLVPEITVTATKVQKSAKKVARAKSKRAPKAATVVSTSWQPDPAAETEATAEETEEAPAATDTTEAVEAESAPAPEPVAAPEPPKPVLPEQLSREQVRQGMEAKRHAVIACAKGAYGKVLADITINQSGKVTSSLIDGTFAGTSVGSCMAGALRGAQFAAFSGPDIQVRYPFSF